MPIVPQPFSEPSGNLDLAALKALKELLARYHQGQHKIQDLLSSLGYALRSSTNLNQFLELIPFMATRLTDADGGALFLFNADGQISLARLHCQEGPQGQAIRQALETAGRQVSPTPPRPATRANTTALDYQVQHYLGQEVQVFGTAIWLKTVERGRLYIFSSDPAYHWTQTRQKLAQLVADQTAVAIENNELTLELSKKEHLDRELEIGAEIQRQLFPRQCPQISGLGLAARCKIAQQVGGDYYDFIPIPARGEDGSLERWSIAIGDVMGKGVPAGLIMTMTRGMLRTEVLNGHSPAQILEHLNLVYYGDLENSHRFVTLFYSEYDPATRTLTYSNAAHNPPLLWQAGTQTIQRLDTLGTLIGLDAHAKYEDAQIQLAPGDTIIYYTDGFTDAPSPTGQRFDEENLITAVDWACRNCSGPQAILDRLFDQVRRFTGSGVCDDDMTLIVLQVVPTGKD